MLDPMERSRILNLFPHKKPKLQINEDETVNMKTADFKSDIVFVSNRLGLSISTVKLALERMERLGVIRIDETGEWIRSEAGHRTTDGIKDLSIRKNHLETGDMAKKAIEDAQYDLCDFTSLTLPLDPEDLTRAKEKIRNFQNEFFKEFNQGKKPKEVYRIALQLFPLTQIKSEKAS